MSLDDGINNDGYLEDGLALAAGITEEYVNKLLEKYDEFYNLIFLLYRVSDFQPPEKWIIPVVSSRECRDLKTQLLVAIEDYEEKHK